MRANTVCQLLLGGIALSFVTACGTGQLGSDPRKPASIPSSAPASDDHLSALKQEMIDDLKLLSKGGDGEGMLPAEARVHFFALTADIPKHRAGYYHHQILHAPEFEQPVECRNLASLVSEQFSLGRRVFASILGNEKGASGHFAVLAVADDGRLVIVDPLAHSSHLLNLGEGQNLVEALNAAAIRDRNGQEIVFHGPEQVVTGQRVEKSDSLVFRKGHWR